jgi:hypothetical protein
MKRYGEHTQRHRVPTKQAVIHLQATSDEHGNAVWYAEAVISGKPEQRCGLRGPIRSTHESQSLQIFMAELGKIIMERSTFLDGRTELPEK